MQKSLDFVKDNNALVTLGIKPSRPETGYGYIQSSDIMLDEFTKVKTFTEKPDLELAKVFMESGEFFSPISPSVSIWAKKNSTQRKNEISSPRTSLTA